MKTPMCATADNPKIGLSDANRDRLRKSCPGAYINQDAEVKPCDGKHAKAVDLKAVAGKPLPRVEEPRAGASPADGAKAPKKGTKRPPAAKKERTPGRCEHCGAPTGGRFAVGHDSKLKSELAIAADEHGDIEAWAELVMRNWARLVAKEKVDPYVRKLGQEQAESEGMALVHRRIKQRWAEADAPVAS